MRWPRPGATLPGVSLLPPDFRIRRDSWDYDRARGSRHSWLAAGHFLHTTALALKFLPFSERSIRVPTAIVGVLSVLLVYFVGAQLFKNQAGGDPVGCVSLALTPASSFTAAWRRLPVPGPFHASLAALPGLLYSSASSERMLFAAGLCLGIGCTATPRHCGHAPVPRVDSWSCCCAERRPAAGASDGRRPAFCCPRRYAFRGSSSIRQ